MITEVKRELIARGVNRKTQIRTEAFFGLVCLRETSNRFRGLPARNSPAPQC